MSKHELFQGCESTQDYGLACEIHALSSVLVLSYRVLKRDLDFLLFPYDFDQDTLPVPAIELAVKDLLPGAKDSELSRVVQPPVTCCFRWTSPLSSPVRLNTSYGKMDSYRAAITWRFLYEQCGGMVSGVEYPAAGMQVIKRALTVLYSGEIRSSFGMDFVDVVLGSAADGQPLTLEFCGAPGADAEFHLELWRMLDPGDGSRPRRVPAQTIAANVLTSTEADGRLVTVIPAIGTAAYNQLGLIITRVDAKESSDPVGAYTIALHAGAGSG